MRLGLSTYTYTWAFGVAGSMPVNPITAIDLINIASQNNITCIQIADNFPLDNLITEELDLIVLYANKNNVNLEIGMRCIQPVLLKKYIHIAQQCKSPILRVVIDGPGFEPNIPDIVDIIKNCIPELISTNIKLAIENHDRLKATEFAEIINKVNSVYVGICLDSVNSLGAGECFEKVIDILLPYTINLHLKDFFVKRVHHKMGFIVEGTPVGKGFLNVPGLISKINTYNKCQSAIIELWTPPENKIEDTIKKEIEWANESINYLKKILK